ncbi:hypothetical protein GMES_1524 [Paraglaciecola mesophila KMM 241]|uniref:Uncharacterized protein n=1 Tax=Paraglaciecola mesophila KMM 241 TaxID=1128912 RepID=K6ZKE0_9ALTE|nr:hypothetical protein [Paraglaciecola mesophila]GAC23820.1 hypothetical protein GMES_1524 [Paraglaciecola mesophila KMM 241]
MRYLNINLLLGACFAMQAKESPAVELLQFYPACDYEVVDTIKVSGRLRFSTGSTDAESLAKTRGKVIQDILDIAQKQRVDGVILTKKSVVLDSLVSESRVARNRISFTAQLVNNCAMGAALSPKATPYDASGLRKFALSFESKIRAKKQHAITYQINTNKLPPPSIESFSIDFEQGVFGLRLQSTYDEAVELFGRPAGVYALDDDLLLVSYGRDLWLTFSNDKLVSVTNRNVWFSNELLSMLDFDARFEKQEWRIFNKVSHDMPMFDVEKALNTQQNSTHTAVLKHSSQTISIEGIAKSVERNRQPDYVASFYSVSHRDFEPSRLDVAHNTHITDSLSQYINGDLELVDVNTLKSLAIGEVASDKDTNLLIMDNHLVVDVTGSTVNRVYLLDSVFRQNKLTINRPWQFGAFKQGQSMAEVKRLLGDDLFSFDDIIEVSDDTFNQEFFFVDYEDELQLSSSEVTFY